jgi:hypothetical protein
MKIASGLVWLLVLVLNIHGFSILNAPSFQARLDATSTISVTTINVTSLCKHTLNTIIYSTGIASDYVFALIFCLIKLVYIDINIRISS